MPGQHRHSSPWVVGSLGKQYHYKQYLHALVTDEKSVRPVLSCQLPRRGESDPALLEIKKNLDNENAGGIVGERGLAGSAQSKEDRDIVRVFAVVGGTVHRHNASLGHKVVHDGEDGFLDFTGIQSPTDQDQFLGQVDQNKGFSGRRVLARDGPQDRNYCDRSHS